MAPPKDPCLDAHFTLVTTPEALGKHWRTCNYCKKLFKGFKAPSRGRAHLGGFDHAGVVACTETPETLRKELLAAQTKEVEQKQKELERKAERERIYKEERDEAEAQKAQKQSKVTDWQHDLRKSLDRQAGRAFYHAGIPFYVAQDPEMEKFITDLIAAVRAGLSAYKLPTRQQLSGPLLDAEYASQQTQFSKFFETDHWTTLQTDGTEAEATAGLHCDGQRRSDAEGQQGSGQ